MERIALIDHSYRVKTKAIDFLKELLRERFAMEEFFDGSWEGKGHVPTETLNQGEYAAIVFFQILPSAEYLRGLRCQNIVWFPMYDSEEKRSPKCYAHYLDIPLKIVSFSTTLHEKLQRLGFDSKLFRYQIKPANEPPATGGLRVFFWIRTNDVTWEMVKILLGNHQVDECIVKITPDPGVNIQPIPAGDIEKYHIQTINEWLDREEYLNILDRMNVFIAPRKSEGIGLSFIEAIAHNMCVIAADRPTMNEYIAHGYNGLLFDPENVRHVDLSKIDAIIRNSHREAEAKSSEWEKRKRGILDYVAATPSPVNVTLRNRFWMHCSFWSYHLRRLKNKLRSGF